MADREVRTRVAPSPTGDPHVGTAYQALFNYAFARRHGGKFILRIEDTDRARSTPESERAILAALRWLGLPWDEGPDVGGPHGPYRQSERLPIYHEQVERLLSAGHAYRCFCTKVRLDAMRASQGASTAYDRHCRDLPASESEARVRAGEPFVVRMKVPRDGVSVMRDLLRGEIRKDWATVDDQIILKSDGFPTYHLGVVVDDHLMGVSHIIRGEEWINSVPKHILLYQYLGWELPVFCHLPLLRNNDATKSKLSKRKNPTSIAYYQRAGFLPEALLNYLGMMGWLMPNGEEKFTVAEMCANLELEQISLGGPVFDLAKLRWLNGRYIREDYTAPELRVKLQEWALGEATLDRIVPLVHARLETLGDWGQLTAPFFADAVPLDPARLSIKSKTPLEIAGYLQLAVWRLEAQRDFTAPALEALLRDMAERLEVKLKLFLGPFYVALSGSPVWTPLYGSMEVLGPDMVRVRLRRAIEALGGLSASQREALEKQYAAFWGSRD